MIIDCRVVMLGIQECIDHKWWIWFNHCVLQPHFYAVAQDLHHAVCKQPGSCHY